MADVFDQSQQTEALQLDAALKAQKARAAATQRPAATGYCLSPLCGDDFEGDMQRLFCGPKCARHFEIYGNK